MRVDRRPDRLVARPERGGERFGDAARIDDRDARVQPGHAQMRNRVQSPDEIGEPARRQHHRIAAGQDGLERSEEHTSELQSLMRISYAVFCLTKKKTKK